jgi:hypothetical protein
VEVKMSDYFRVVNSGDCLSDDLETPFIVRKNNCEFLVFKRFGADAYGLIELEDGYEQHGSYDDIETIFEDGFVFREAELKLK